MKAKIKGYEIECSTDEFKELIKMPKTVPILGKKQSRKEKPWTSGEVCEAWALLAKGAKLKVIARKMGRTRSAIYNLRLRIERKDTSIMKKLKGNEAGQA